MAIQQEYEAAKKANELRYSQAMAIYDEIIKRYQPGGTFGKAALSQLETQKVRETGKGMQQLISSGLYGTTTAAGLGQKWEEEVGAPSRLRLEDIMMERLSQAQVGKAGFMERKQDVYPDVGMYAQYAGQAAAAGGGAGDRRGSKFGGTPSAYGGTQAWGSYGVAARPGLPPKTTATTAATGRISDSTPWAQTTPGYGLADRPEALKVERGPGGVYLAGQKASYTTEQSAWLKQQGAKLRAAQEASWTSA
jgi:hypothetical protein